MSKTIRWQTYPEYKDSSVEWVGEIPVHWEVMRLKNTVTACQNGTWGDEPAGGENDIVCVRVADFDRTRYRVSNENFTIRSIPQNQQRKLLLSNGDLLLEKSGGGDLQPVGQVVLFDLPAVAITSNFIAKMPVAERYNSNFLCYLHNTLYAGRINTRSIKQNTGIQNLDSSAYLDEKVGFPPLPEQRAIADFLDRETVKLDSLMAKKRRLIELLQEKRAALISRAVTKGLNPDVPMKDSGIEWLGEIPAHWSVSRFKHLTKIISKGTTPTTVGGEFSDEGVRFIKAENIWNGLITDKPATFIDVATDRLLQRSILQAGDVLIVIAGATTGKVGVVAENHLPANTNQAVAFARPMKQDLSRFLFYWVSSLKIQEQVWFLAVQAAQPNLSLEDIRNFLVPTPLLEEIKAIVIYLDCETKKVDALIAKTQETIEKLKEYRTALISAAVTGKIDVRETISTNGGDDGEAS